MAWALGVYSRDLASLGSVLLASQWFSSLSSWTRGSFGSGASVPYRLTVMASRMTHLDLETSLTCSSSLWLTRPVETEAKFCQQQQVLCRLCVSSEEAELVDVLRRG